MSEDLERGSGCQAHMQTGREKQVDLGGQSSGYKENWRDGIGAHGNRERIQVASAPFYQGLHLSAASDGSR